jgi:putative transposase
MKKRFTDEQVVTGLRKVDGGMPVKEFSREMAIFEPTYYQWKRKFSGMVASDLRRLGTFEDENAWLKRLVADRALDIAIRKEIFPRESSRGRGQAGRCRSTQGEER